MNTKPSEAAMKAADNKYRKKPVVIEAHQWDGTYQDAERIKRLFPHMREASMAYHIENNTVSFWDIKTLEGKHYVSPGDFIIQGVKGEYYPCKPDIFALTYEPAIIDQAFPQPEESHCAECDTIGKARCSHHGIEASTQPVQVKGMKTPLTDKFDMENAAALACDKSETHVAIARAYGRALLHARQLEERLAATNASHAETVRELVEALKGLELSFDTLATFHRHSPVWKQFKVNEWIECAKQLIQKHSQGGK